MSLEDVVRAALTDGAGSRPAGSLADQVAELKTRYGSGRKAAKATGIPESTLRRVAKTGRAGSANLDKLDQGVRSGRVSGTLTDANLKISATDRTSGREREITATQLKLKPGTVERMRAAYVAGDDQGAAKALLDGIGDTWYRGWLTPGSTLSRTGTEDGQGGGPQAAAGKARGGPEEGGGGSGGGSSSGSGGGSGSEGWDDDYDDWADSHYDGQDIDSDYGATVGGVSS